MLRRGQARRSKRPLIAAIVTLSGADADRFTRTFDIDLRAKSNDIRVEAFNGVSMGVAEMYIGLPTDVRPSAVRGNLYVFAVGVNAFTNLPPALNLAFAAQDAEAMAETLKRQAAGTYEQVYVKILSDGETVKPERAAILSALDFVSRPGRSTRSSFFWRPMASPIRRATTISCPATPNARTSSPCSGASRAALRSCRGRCSSTRSAARRAGAS